MSTDDLDDGLEYEVDISEDEGISLGPDSEERTAESSQEERTSGEESRKRSKSTSKFQEKKKLKMQMDIDSKQALSKEGSVEVIADRLNEALRRRNPDLSALELAELYFRKSDFRSTAEYTGVRNLENLPKFILSRFDNMLKSTKKKESKKPVKQQSGDDKEQRKFIAILSMSAIRSCDVHRALRDLPGSSLKLINKNKIDVDLKLVKTTWSRVLCCTPGRLQKVLDTVNSPLLRDEIKIVIVDNTYLDKKKQNVFDIKETTEVLKNLTEQGSKIYLY